VEPQQLATKVAQLESRVATLEDENKIVKGEVKQILTEIRSAILVRDNPFDSDGGMARSAPPLSIVPSEPLPPVAAPEAAPAAPPPPAPRAARPADEPHDMFEAPREPIPLRPQLPQPMQAAVPTWQMPLPAPAPAPAPAEQPQWSLLTIAGLAAWAEEAMGRVGSLRLEILLDLCEAAGHLTPEARIALARVTELDINEPSRTPSNNETVTILRQLDALVNDDEDSDSARLQRRV
jgi:hypothetical protein